MDNLIKKYRKLLSYFCIFILFTTMIQITAFAGSYSDISSHWAKNQINNLLDKEVIKGYPDGTFKPNNPITRAEFMAIVNRAFHFTTLADHNYIDVNSNAWYTDTIKQAKYAGYLSGYLDGTIKPNNNITRQEAACIIMKIKQLKENASSIEGYQDALEIPSWSKGAIGAVLDSKIMSGYPDNTFRASNLITRAEAAVTVDKALQEIYTKAGTYGPETGLKNIKGDVNLLAGDIILQNILIEGNLILTKNIGEGNITLKNVTVKGTTQVNGGGENSVIVMDSTLGKVTVAKENGKIRIVVSGNTTIGQVTANSGVKLEENNLIRNALGFENIIIDAKENSKIILLGNFEEIQVNAKGIAIHTTESSSIQNLIVNSPATITGTGTIKVAQINTNGTTFEKTPVKLISNVKGENPVNNTGKGSHNNGKGSHNSVEYADKVLKNGIVFSVNSTSKDDKGIKNEAVAIENGIVTYVGSNEGVNQYINSNTQVIDLKGKMVLPGFSDAHAHAKAMAANMFDLSLYSGKTKAEYLEKIKAWYNEHTPTYITGNGWDTLIADQLSKEDLDNIPGLKDIPIVLYDASHHMAWANSKAIEERGLTATTPNPPGGLIVRQGGGALGEPTGIFHEDSAIGLVMNPAWDNTVEQYKAGLLAFQTMANAYGITLNQDPQLSENAMKAYEEIAKEGKMTLRISGGFLSSPVIDGANYADSKKTEAEIDTYIEHIKKLQAEYQVGDLFKLNFVKIYGDGGGPTTFMKNPPNGFGVWDQAQLKMFCNKLEENGFQIHGHAMGDAALAAFLDAFQDAKDNGYTGLRNSITHLQFVDDGKNGGTDDAQRMVDLGIIGIPQPFWMIRDPYYTAYWAFVSEDRASESYPMKSLIEKGVIMAGGSDWPVTIPNAPLVSLQSGVTRTLAYDDPALAYTPDMSRNPMYQYPLEPTDETKKECVDTKTMIQSLTINGAYATFLEKVTGSIEVGKSADMVVLDKNLFEVPSKDIGKSNVMMTLFKGNVVYQSSDLTISNHNVVVYKSAPSYPGDANPYGLVVANGTTTKGLIDALNTPIGGSFEIKYKDVKKESPAINKETLVNDSMIIASTSGKDSAVIYGLTVLPARIPNGFTVANVSDQGCTITLNTVIAGLTTDDIYLLRDSNKVSATITSITTPDNGKTYLIEAKDLDSKGNLIPLNGKHNVYVYSPYHPIDIPVPDHDFGNSQGQEINP